jgi:hypothetical protein
VAKPSTTRCAGAPEEGTGGRGKDYSKNAADGSAYGQLRRSGALTDGQPTERYDGGPEEGSRGFAGSPYPKRTRTGPIERARSLYTPGSRARATLRGGPATAPALRRQTRLPSGARLALATDDGQVSRAREP